MLSSVHATAFFNMESASIAKRGVSNAEAPRFLHGIQGIPHGDSLKLLHFWYSIVLWIIDASSAEHYIICEPGDAVQHSAWYLLPTVFLQRGVSLK